MAGGISEFPFFVEIADSWNSESIARYQKTWDAFHESADIKKANVHGENNILFTL